MRWIVAIACMTTFAACLPSDGPGSSNLSESDSKNFEIPILADAVVLEPGSIEADAYATGDSDASSHDAAVESDTYPGATDLSPADLPAALDALFLGETVLSDEAYLALDGEAGLPCSDDPESDPNCIRIHECSEKGASAVEELIHLLMNGAGEVHVKVKTQAWPGVQTCSMLDVCTSEHPCCKSCFAPMFIGSEIFPIVLSGMEISIGCQGTECDVLDNCSPIMPGMWYWLWGKVGILGGKAQFSVEGFCPVDAQRNGL